MADDSDERLTAHGWAVVENDEINVRTVSPTRIAALINWLVTAHRIIIYWDTPDERVEAMWEERRGKADVKPVRIRETEE